MKKIVPALLMLVNVSPAFAGQIVYKNMYAKHTLIQGVGLTTEEAKKDAFSALPAGDQKENG